MAAPSHPVPYTTATNNSLAKDLTVFVGLIVDKVLDVGILHHAAQDLVTQWPILGGQLITRTNPYSFKAGNTVDFKSQTIVKPLHEYFPLDFHIVDLESPTYLGQVGGKSRDQLFHFDSSRPLNILPDTLLAIRVTALEDATLLGFRVPHHFCDGQSVYDIVAAYCQVISRKTLPVLILPPDVDQPLSTLLKANTEVKLPVGIGVENVPYLNPNENLKVGFAAWVRYVGYAVSKMVGSKFFLSSKSEEKFIHLPGKLVETWRSQCQEELEEGASAGDKAPTLTKLDVITAWFLQYTPPDDGPVDLMYNFSYRFALPAPEPNTKYLKNSYYELRVHWDSLSKFQASSLASLAASIRTTVLRSKQSSIIKANLEFQEQHATELVAPGAQGTRLDRLPFVSSWTREEYAGLDFSAAMADGGKVAGEGDAKVVFVQPKVALPLGITVDPLAIVVKDHQGGYWLRANLSKSGWNGHGL